MTHPSHVMHNAMQQPLPEPPQRMQDMPTVWIPTDASGAMGAQPTSQGRRNTLALISLLASLIFPLAVTINVLGAVALANHLIAQQAMMVFFMAGGAFGTLGLPAMISAIATGHVALVIAKRYTRSGARRWMAIVGLVHRLSESAGAPQCHGDLHHREYEYECGLIALVASRVWYTPWSVR